MKKIFIISISAILGMFTQIDSSYAAGRCGIGSLNTSTNGSGYSYRGFTRLNGNTGSKESNYGLTRGSGQWAVQFSYGTVWGMAKCSETAGNNSSNTWPASSKSNWLKTPSDTTGQYCWCQATGFTASGNSYTSGPQCTTTASSLWMYNSNYTSSANCANSCADGCSTNVYSVAAFRPAVFGAAGVVPVELAWYDNGTTISGPSSCTVGGTFVPPTPPARPGYIFAGWRVKEKCGINNLDTDIKGTEYGYTNHDSGNTYRQSNYGLTTGSGQWAVEFSYGTVWGMANCNNTNGTYAVADTPTLASSGQYCWCQVTGFTASGNSYTSGPQCTTDASSLWVFKGSASSCAWTCAGSCSGAIKQTASIMREAMFGAVGQ